MHFFMENQMGNQSSNPNLEWKKGGFETKEQLTLKTNVRKAVEYDAKKDSLFKTKPTSAELGKGLKKISKKIKKDAYDDDDEDENAQVTADSLALTESNSLYNALKEDEKKFLKQQDNTNRIVSSHLDVNKVNSITKAQKMMKRAGFIGLKKDTVRKAIRDNKIGENAVNKTIEKDFKKELNLKGSRKFRNMSEHDLFEMIKGVHTSKEIAGKDGMKALQDLDVKEIREIGHEDLKRPEKAPKTAVAKKICEKTGRSVCQAPKKEKKEPTEKEFEKLIAKQRAMNRNFANER